jgi:hypothetical protein
VAATVKLVSVNVTAIRGVGRRRTPAEELDALCHDFRAITLAAAVARLVLPRGDFALDEDLTAFL